MKRLSLLSYFFLFAVAVARHASADTGTDADKEKAEAAKEQLKAEEAEETDTANVKEVPPPVVKKPDSFFAFIKGKLGGTIYGFVSADIIYDTTQSFDQVPGNAPIFRDGTYRGENGRFSFDIRRSRIGYRLDPIELGPFKMFGLVEFDFRGHLGADAPESVVFSAPLPRLRHAMVRLDSPSVSLLGGLWWSLFAYQPIYFPPSLTFGFGPGEPFLRKVQFRASHTYKTPSVHIETSGAIAQPPQSDAQYPEGQAGLKVDFVKLKGMRSLGNMFVQEHPASMAVSAIVRSIKYPQTDLSSPDSRSWTSYAFAFNFELPIIPVRTKAKGHALTFSGMAQGGVGNSDQVLRGAGGVGPSPRYPAKDLPAIEPGVLGFSRTNPMDDGLVRWRTFRASLEYYLPPTRDIWFASTIQSTDSTNIGTFVANPNLVPPAAIKRSFFVDVNALINVGDSLRLGIQYAHFAQLFTDSETATNERFMLSMFYFL